MIKEIETTKLLTIVEQDGKIVGLYFEHELPPLRLLYDKYGKKNVRTTSIKTKRYITVLSDDEYRRRVVRSIDNKAISSK